MSTVLAESTSTESINDNHGASTEPSPDDAAVTNDSTRAHSNSSTTPATLETTSSVATVESSMSEATPKSSSTPLPTLSSTIQSTSNSSVLNITSSTVSGQNQFNSTNKTSDSGFKDVTDVVKGSSFDVQTADKTTRHSQTSPLTTSTASVTTKLNTTFDTASAAGSLSTSGLVTHNTEADQPTSGDLSRAIGVTVAVAVAVWVVTVIIFVVCLYKMRQKWRRKLQEERQRTDIWSMSTFHNTIINDNFMDYKLAPPSRKNRSSDASNAPLAQLKQPRFSSGALSRASSIYNDDYTFRQSIIRRSTLSDDERFRFSRSKSRAKRQPSNYSSESWLEPSTEFRARTSTFNIGKRNRISKHALVNNDELRMSGSRSFDGFDMMEKQSMSPRSESQDQPYYVTEL